MAGVQILSQREAARLRPGSVRPSACIAWPRQSTRLPAIARQHHQRRTYRSRSGRSQTGRRMQAPRSRGASARSMPRAGTARTSQAASEQRQRPGRAAGQRARPAVAQTSGYCSTEAANADRRQRADGARPAQLVAQQGRQARSPAPWSPAPWRPARTVSPSARDQPAQHVVVGQMVDQRRQAADRAPASRGAAPSWRPRQSCRPSARASSAPGRKLWVICVAPSRAARRRMRRQPGIQRGDQPDTGLGQRRRRAASGSRARHARRCRRSPGRRAAPRAAC